MFTAIEVCVQFRVEDPVKYFYQLTDVHSQVTAYVYSVIRSIIPTLDLDDVFMSKSAIGDAVETELNAKFSEFGTSFSRTSHAPVFQFFPLMSAAVVS